jgi:hypothetical protein
MDTCRRELRCCIQNDRTRPCRARSGCHGTLRLAGVVAALDARADEPQAGIALHTEEILGLELLVEYRHVRMHAIGDPQSRSTELLAKIIGVPQQRVPVTFVRKAGLPDSNIGRWYS